MLAPADADAAAARTVALDMVVSDPAGILPFDPFDRPRLKASHVPDAVQARCAGLCAIAAEP
jgi:hypothetical protein